MKYDIERLKKQNFQNARVTNYCNYSDSLLIYGDFAVGDVPHFVLEFQNIPNKQPKLLSEYLIGLKITRIEITDTEPYCVEIAFNNSKVFAFSCKRVFLKMKMYKGKSYKNVYPEWEKELEKSAYAESADYFKNEENIELPEGYSLNVKSYMDMTERAVKAELCVFELTKNGEHVYNWRCTYHHPCTFKGLICHSNGHKYLPFQVDLYGISYLDLDSGEVYNYIPEGYEHDIDQYCGESFIITDIHYDRRSDLIAYGGCYWAGPSDVMVGDFSEPPKYAPHLASLSEIIDPECDFGYDVDFVRFENNALVVKTDDGEAPPIDLNVLRRKIKEL